MEEVTPSTLHLLPHVDKPAIRTAGRDAQSRHDLVCHEVFTSGTTGRPLVTVRGDREQDYVRRFFSAVHRDRPEAPLARGLQLNNPYHGHQVAIPAPIHFHRIGIYDSGSFEHAWGVLEGTHDDRDVEPRVTIVVGIERGLRALCHATEAAGRAPLRTAVSHVVSFTQYVTARWRERIESVLGGRLVDRWSMAEVFGGATRCAECGWWHFDPFLIPEVVGARSGRPVPEGAGILLVTSLYPFQEAQPMIRYWTGDLVEATVSRSCRPGELSVRLLGRAQYGVPAAEGDGWLVAPATALELVEEVPEIARVPRFLDSPQVVDPYGIGHPRYRLSHAVERGVVAVTLELQLERTVAQQRLEQLQRELRTGLLRANPSLAAAEAERRATVDVRIGDEVDADLIAHSA